MSVSAIIRNLKRHFKQFVVRLFFLLIPRIIPQLKQRQMGINLIGYYQGDLGLGEALRYIARAIDKVSIPFLVRRFSAPLLSSQSNKTLDPYLSDYCQYPINCITVNPDLLYRLPAWVGLSEWANRYNVAYWFWELKNFPQEWRYALSLIDEIWVNTEFIASSMRQAHKRVIKIPFAVEFDQPDAQYTRQYFQLPETGLLFLTSFDFNSAVARKNPQATIDAFLMAFPPEDKEVFLIVKSINKHLHPKTFATLTQRANHDSRIIFMDEQLSSAQMRGLLNCADSYISLHRSEGLGLGMAESMYLGKAVVGTAYSGNLEFMNASNSSLVTYDEVAVDPADYHYSKNQAWANAHIPCAAAALQKIAHDKAFRKTLGENAQRYMREHHSFDVMGKAIAKRLEEIALLY